MTHQSSEFFMEQALNQARQAQAVGEIPIGAVIVQNNEIVAAAYNLCETNKNPLAHAEMLAITLAAAKLKDWRLADCTLFVTVEPCVMCLGALLQARVAQLTFGCFDAKRAQLKLSHFSTLQGITELRDSNHLLKISGGVLEKACAALLKDFFKQRRV